MPRGRILLLTFLLLLLVGPQPAKGTILPARFRERTVFSGLDEPTSVAFSADGRVFVAEKRGVILVFDSLTDTTPTVFADLRTQVYNGSDRGLLGLALDPNFPQRPYVYVLYTFDAAIGGTAPRWGTPGQDGDPCPDPPGLETDGCVVSGRLSRLTASGDTMVGAENVLINDWCQQFGSHSVGHLAFGSDGALYASAGEGAGYNGIDYGQYGYPQHNPCGDPPTGLGGTQTPPTAEGGALRAQDLRTPGDPTTLDGSLIRVDPDTGAALPTNPLASSPDTKARRVVAYGFRNAFRFAIRPGTNDVWVGNVGWNDYEAIDRVADPTGPNAPYDFGWPCYEGTKRPWGPWRQPAYDNADLNICENLYADPSAVARAYYSYQHREPVVFGEDCGVYTSAISGLAFYPGGSYPSSYDGALFFADYARGCIWVMQPGQNGVPSPNKISVFAHDSNSPPDPVDLEAGPGGDLFWVDFFGGTIRQIQYFAGNQPPTAVLDANPAEGHLPLTTHLDASRSTDPENQPLTYAWDLNDDGQFNDATGPTPPNQTYTQAGNHTVSVRVTDSSGASDVAAVVIHAGNTSPTATIDAPDPSLHWSVGDKIQLAGSATDAEDGPLGGSNLVWTVEIEHCPAGEGCHLHPLTTFTGAGQTITAPDHEYLSRLLIKLTATDSGGLQDTATLRLDPATHTVSLDSDPEGIDVGLGTVSGPTPRSQTVISGSRLTVVARSAETLNHVDWTFDHWSDGGARVHDFTASADLALTASYSAVDCTANPTPTTTLEAARPHRRSIVIRGVSSDLGCDVEGEIPHPGGVASVGVYLARQQSGHCRFLGAGKRFGPSAPCGDPSLLPATGTDTWNRTLRLGLPPGRYLAGALATDNQGSREAPGPGNKTTFRVR